MKKDDHRIIYAEDGTAAKRVLASMKEAGDELLVFALPGELASEPALDQADRADQQRIAAAH